MGVIALRLRNLNLVALKNGMGVGVGVIVTLLSDIVGTFGAEGLQLINNTVQKRISSEILFIFPSNYIPAPSCFHRKQEICL